MRTRFKSLATLLTLLALSGCGGEDCFSLGPFGNCGDQEPVRSRGTQAGDADDGNNPPVPAGQLHARTDRQPIPGTPLEIRVTGGEAPYFFEVVEGPGRMVDGSNNESRNGRFYLVTAEEAQRGRTVVIRVTESSVDRRMYELALRIQR